MKISKEKLRRFAPFILVLTGLAIFVVWNFPGKNADIQESVAAVPMMSTTATFKLTGDSRTVDKAVREAVQAMNRVSEICNIFDPESELSRLNRSAAEKPFACSAELWEILRLARRFYYLSDGAFDPTIRPLMSLWGFHRKRSAVPSAEEIQQTLEKCGFDRLRFDEKERTVFFTVPGMSVDLGGIAKGWAVDRAAAAVRKCGVSSGIIDLGGNMLCFGSPAADREEFRVAVRHPKDRNKTCAVLTFPSGAVATSGSYERFTEINGVRYSHIMNPLTGYPVSSDILSATIVAENAVTADALSTSLFILGKNFEEKLKHEMPSVKCLLIRESDLP